ncbi:MAG: malto-oligosyltrehalose trehalohydrolase [Cyanobacteria bacterium J06649_5]
MQIGASFEGANLKGVNLEGADAEKSAATGCDFLVWGPLLEQVAVEVIQAEGASGSRHSSSRQQSAQTQWLPMTKNERGYWHVNAPELTAGTRYKYQINGEEAWPDPASRYQPEGVHGPSEVVNHAEFDWQDDDWHGIVLAEYIIYELHVGTFTPDGTFEAAIAQIPDLVALGITAIEIMPVAQFPGDRNWGYDGVYPFAVQNSYGGPNGLKQFVQACHQQGVAVIMDVVYNHFGPEGNYTGKFGPYTTDRYRTPWGNAINFDDAYSDGVRRYFIENAISWLRDYHIDALRLDAVHAIYDFGAQHFLHALSEAVDVFDMGRRQQTYLIAESDLNDPRLVRPASQGGYQLDAQWSDDFHHALHTRLTGETIGYYSDFTSLETLASAIRDRFAYAGQYSPFRRRNHGSPAIDLPSDRFVVCSQNHDQVGNRMTGDRFSQIISFEGQKLAAGITILSPYIPLLFMGEEYGENAPFLYFVSHGDEHLIESVRKGRKEEFRAFHSEGTPPDPASPKTFHNSVLHWVPKSDTAKPASQQADVVGQNTPAQQSLLHRFYKRLIEVRKQCKLMVIAQHPDITVEHTNDLLYYRRAMKSGDLLCLMNFGESTLVLDDLPLGDKTWSQRVSSIDAEWCTVPPDEPDLLPKTLTAKTTPKVSLPSLSITLYQSDPDIGFV